MFRLTRFLKNYKFETIIGPIFKLIEAIFELIVPLVMAKIIDVGIKGGDTAYVWRMGGIMVALGLAGLCFALVCQYVASKASQGAGTQIRRSLYAHINTLSHRELDALGTDTLITRITNDVNQVQNAFAMTIRLATRAPFLIIGSAVMAFMIDWQLALIFVVTAPIIALILWFIMQKSVPFYKGIQKKIDHITTLSNENLSGNRVIRAFSRQDYEEARFDESCEDLNKTSLGVARLQALLNPLTSVVLNIAIVAILYFGAKRVDSGAVLQGQIIALVNYMTQILLASIVLANLISMYTKSVASAARINEVFDTKTTLESGEITCGKAGTPKVEFKNVTFGYGGEKPALQNVSFQALSGETIGVIGGTGSGKTSLINLIPRFYDALSGEVLVDGVNVKDYDFDALRGKVGIAPQKAVLFSGTIAQNLRWGNPDADDEDLQAAAEIAQAKEFIEAYPAGYNHAVNQGGKNFSGGQLQRLTIARAIAAKPEILILDDSSSALDYLTDYNLRRAIATKIKQATVFIVSQRASSVRFADKIIVLDGGEVDGIGTHEELIQTSEVYREIVFSQMPEKEAAI